MKCCLARRTWLQGSRRSGPGKRGLKHGRYWIRTSDPFRVKEVRYRCANRPHRATLKHHRSLPSTPCRPWPLISHDGAQIRPARACPGGHATRPQRFHA